MDQGQLMQIKLSRFDAQPWGFRLQGGVDFAAPLLVQKVNAGSLAEQAGLLPGDAVLKINDVDVFSLRHKEAQDIVVRSGNNFVITVQRGGSTWRPQVTPTGHLPQPNQNSPYLQTVTKTSLAHRPQEVHHIGSGYNNSARPFANGGDGSVKSIVNKQYNTPVGIYSDESIAETLSAQAEVLAGGVLGVNFKKNEKEYQAEKSEVLKFLREEETSGDHTPAFNNHQYQEPQHQQQQQHYHQQQQQHQHQQHQQHQQQQHHHQSQTHHHQQQQHQQQSATRHVSAPINSPKPPSTGGLPTGQNICTECERLITGVFVRIKDKNLHVECFKCATCGTSLKNQGYYNFNNKLYCDIHAKLAAMQNPPPGTEGYVPVPIKPNTKLSASTISSALNAHGFSNGYSNGGSAPAPVNQGYARPFGATASPAAAAPRSPVSYPPQQQQQQWGGQQQAPKPAVSPYATLPRSNAGQQEAVDQGFEPQYEDVCYQEPSRPAGAACFEDDPELIEANRQNRMNFAWPPPRDDCHDMPTAAPLYIAPPETQHVIPKIIQNPPPPPPDTMRRESRSSQQEQQQQQEAQYYMEQQQTMQQQQQLEQQQLQQQQQQWQSRSAPQLTVGGAPDIESSSDSYTSTCTTTTTTSEEYQRMYNAQMQAYQMQQMLEQSGSELEMDMELANMLQQQQQEQQSYLSISECMSGRRSTQECAESLSAPLSTNQLIDMVREVTPSPEPPHPPRHVIFADEPEIKEVPSTQSVVSSEPLEPIPEMMGEDIVTNGCAEEHLISAEESLVIEDRREILESQRIFQPTPEIKIEIPPVRQIPPTKIPNPMPKEWINPMVRVLTTASDVPFHMVGCLCPKPCDCKCDADCVPEVQMKAEAKVPETTTAPDRVAAPVPQPAAQIKNEPSEQPATIAPEFIHEIPPFGSFMSKAMATAPEFSVRFVAPASQEVPLPEETEPYMPPPIDMKPYLREDYRPKTPLLSALTTAPDRPFEGHFDRDVPIHDIDLPTPREHLTMSDALRTAPERAYTPLNPENATHMFEKQEKAKEKKKYEFQVLDREQQVTEMAAEKVEYYTTERSQQQRKSSAFAAMQAFQPSREPLTPATPRQSVISLSQSESDLEYEKYCKAKERNEKRLNYYHKKEEEMQQQQQQQQQQLQQQTEHEQTNICQMSSSRKQSSLSTKTSSTVQQKQQQQQQLLSYNNNNNTTSSTPASANNATQASASASGSTYAATSTAAASTVSSSSTSAFRTMTSDSTRKQLSTSSKTASTKIDAHEIIEETVDELEHSEVLFPPPSPLSHLKGKTSSGLHKADTIPKYQRNWTVLPTQSPVRTPEPQELRDNVPLAFVDAPKTPSAVISSASNPVHRPMAQISTAASQRSSATTAAAARSSITSTSAVSSTKEQRVSSEQRTTQQQQQSLAAKHYAQQQQQQHQQATKTTVPIIVKDRSGPVSMAFQPLDEHLQADQSQTPTRPYTPSMTNKPAPIIPFYQTPEKLLFDECPATHARDYDRRSASPYPDGARSPAPGPPPNPLSAIRAPRMKENEMSPMSPRVLQAGSITTGQSYLGAQQQAQQQQQQQLQQQSKVLSHFESSSQAGMQSFIDKPATFEERQIGDLTIQKREKESRLEEQKKLQEQSQTTTQVGNTQIERRRRVTEEFEHTQSAKTVEIRTGTSQTTAQTSSQVANSNERRQSYGKTGFVANQARRLSGLEQEITNLTSQSQAISARAAHLGETTTFPQLKSPEPTSKFPLSPILPSHDEPQRPSYVLSSPAANKMVGPPPGFQHKPEQQQQKLPTAYGTPLVCQQQQQQQQKLEQQQQLEQKSLSAFSSINTTTSSSIQANTASRCLTKASATNTQQQQQQATSATCNAPTTGAAPGGSVALGVCPVTGTFCRPGHTCCKQLQLQKFATPTAATATSTAAASPYSNNNINAYRPNASTTGSSAFKSATASATSTATAAASAISATAVAPAQSAASTNIPPITTTTNLLNQTSGQTNVGDSSGAGKPQGGAFGATSAPKRGRGVFNKAVAPGVRVPHCNSCQMQIRGPFITALGRIWCPDHFICVNGNCRRPLQDIGFVEEKGDLYCEYCFEKYLAPTCSKCAGKIKGDCLNAIGKHFHPECFTCGHCGKLFGNTPFFLEEGKAYCEADWNELFTTKCYACGFPVEAGDRWVEALNHNYHSQCFNCTFCKQNLEGQSFYNKGGRPFCKNHAR